VRATGARIGAVLGCPIGTVKAHIARGKKHLRARVLLLAALLAAVLLVATIMPAMVQPSGFAGAMVLCLG
jgi:hypothetical protein